MNKKIIIIIIIIIIIYFFRDIKNYILFDRQHYNNTTTKLVKDKKEYSSEISLYFFQTYKDKKKIPKEVYDNIKTYAPEYKHIIFDNKDSEEFLYTYFEPIVLETFKKLKLGAHKADLLRYCLLYIYGGVYMDIHKEFLVPLSEILIDKNMIYSIIGDDTIHISQGFIATPSRHKFFLSLIYYIVKTGNPLYYHQFCQDFMYQIESDINKKVDYGLNKNSKQQYYLLNEKCSISDCSMCNNKFDRYGKCCIIWDKDKPIMNARRSSYPW